MSQSVCEEFASRILGPYGAQLRSVVFHRWSSEKRTSSLGFAKMVQALKSHQNILELHIYGSDLNTHAWTEVCIWLESHKFHQLAFGDLNYAVMDWDPRIIPLLGAQSQLEQLTISGLL